jgi:hypothetical protein
VSEIRPKAIDLTSGLFAVCALTFCDNAASARGKINPRNNPFPEKIVRVVSG